MKDKLNLIEIQELLDQNLPYFKLSDQEDKSIRIRYNGKTIEDWRKFEKFTGKIGLPLDFSGSFYVGVTTTLEKLQAAIQSIFSI